MDYSRFTIEEFVIDKAFRKWVVAPDVHTNLFWEDFLTRHPHQADAVAAARDIILGMSLPKFELDDTGEEALWGRISRDMDADIQTNGPRMIPLNARVLVQKSQGTGSGRRGRRVAARLAVAAMISLLIAVSSWFVISEITTDETRLVTQASEPGTKLEVVLPDGSRVLLNAASTVQYANHFKGDRRDVYLTGEAFFEVRKDPTRPFTVHAGALSTTALGTSFNVAAYADEGAVVSLLSGRVFVCADDCVGEEGGTVLEEGESAMLREGAVIKGVFDEEAVIGWTKGTLVFAATPVAQAMQTLERWYGVTIVLENPPKAGLLVSGRYENESLLNVLEGMSYATRFSFRMENQRIYVEFE